MARLSIDGLSEIIGDFEKLAKTPQAVLYKMVKSGGEVLAKAQRKNAQTMLKGEYYQGAVAEGVVVKEPKGIGGSTSVDITFKGTQHGNRIAEIAFVNEYGKKNQPARPFIRTANDESEDTAVEAAEKDYHEYVDSTGL